MTGVSAKTGAPAAVRVRRARDDELRACRMLLSDAFFPTRAPDLLVAVDVTANRLLGAAAVGWIPGGFPVQAHVLPHVRRRGIGRQLIETVATAVAGETARLRSWAMIPEGSVAEVFLTACGFGTKRRFLTFESDARHSQALIAAVRRRLDRRSGMPSTGRVVGIEEAPRDAVASLVATELGSVPSRVAARLGAEGAGGYSRDTSVAAMVGDELAGALLSTREGDLARMDVNVVAPAHRRGWVNVWLLDEAIRRCVASGARRLRYVCDERTRDTVNLAKRSGARPVGAGLILERRLEV